MGDYKNGLMTNQGRALLINTILGISKIEFVSMASGNGVYTGDENIKEMTQLLSYQQTFPISTITTENNNESIKITSIFNNSAVTQTYAITEIGIMAIDSLDSTATPILYAVVLAAEPDIMTAYVAGNPVITFQEDVHLIVSDAEDVTITIVPGACAPADQTYTKTEVDTAINNIGSENSIQLTSSVGMGGAACYYTKIGALVHLEVQNFTYMITNNQAPNILINLPYNCKRTVNTVFVDNNLIPIIATVYSSGSVGGTRISFSFIAGVNSNDFAGVASTLSIDYMIDN